VRLVARPGSPPLGLVFFGIGLLAAAAVGLLRLDRLPLTLCVFKGLTGLPCPTCGSTRTLGQLFALDVAGAWSQNPLATLGAVAVATWGLVDLALLPRRRAVGLEIAPRLGRALRWGALGLFLANWIYLIAAGR
jgi:hypothetical protein